MTPTLRLVSSCALLLGAPTAFAANLSCDDIMNMVDHSVPSTVVVDTIKQAGGRFSDAEIQCLLDRGAYPEVIELARSRKVEATPAPAPTRRAEPEDDRASARRRFEDADTLTGDLDEDFGDEAGGYGASDLDQYIRDYKARKYRTASYGLFQLLEENAYPEKDSVIKYYLAKSLQGLEMYHAAQVYYMEVIRKGPSNPLFKHALPRLAQVSTRIGDDFELLRIVGKISPESFPRQARPHMYYLLGRKALEADQLADAVAAFEQVPTNHILYPRAQYLAGTIQYKRDKLKSAVRAFREVIRSDIPTEDPKLVREIEDLKDLAILNIARVYYALQKLETAESYYEKVDRASTHWPQALFEQAWARFFLGDLNKTLGLLMTAGSPFFDKTHFLPDTQYLRALSYFQLCEYTDVDRVLTLFEVRHVPMRNELKEVIDRFRTEAGQQSFDVAFDLFFGDQATADTELPVALFARILRNRDLASLIQHLDVIQSEMDAVRSQTPQWRDTLGQHLNSQLARDMQRYKERAGRVLLQQMLTEYRNLETLLQDADILRFEVADAQRQDYMFKMSNPRVDDFAAQNIDFAVDPRYIYWPFNGEFWSDELAYYQFAEQGSCN